MKKGLCHIFLVWLLLLLLICNETAMTLTPTPVTSVYLDCPGILNDVKVCTNCRIEDAWGITPEGCILVERRE